jgi:hypothetical protein
MSLEWKERKKKKKKKKKREREREKASGKEKGTKANEAKAARAKHQPASGQMGSKLRRVALTFANIERASHSLLIWRGHGVGEIAGIHKIKKSRRIFYIRKFPFCSKKRSNGIGPFLIFQS